MGASLWRLNGQLMVTVVTKATFSFADPKALRLVDAVRVRQADEHLGGHPMRSLVGASDVAPQLHRMDVTLVGSACPPAPAPQHLVRLAIANQAGVMLDKTLLVVGERTEGEEPAPFTELPLEWERSFGGIGHSDNPIGMGMGSEKSQLPHVLPQDGSMRTVGFAPIPASFPSRRQKLEPKARKLIAKRVMEVPAEIDWSYFQAAPTDQQLDSLRGDEWVALDGFNAQHPQIRFRLPGGLAVCRVYGYERAGAPNHVPLVLDGLHVETAEMRLSLVWRGSFPIMVEEALNGLVIAGAYLATAEAFEWPAEADLKALPHEPSVVAGADLPPRDEIDLEGTSTIDPSELDGRVRTLPFAGKKQQLPSAVTGRELEDHPLSGTVALEGKPPSSPALPPAMIADIPLDGTMAITGSAPGGEALPFPEAPPASSKRSPAAIPGAPWAGNADESPPVVPPVVPPSAAGTVDVDEPAIPAIADARAKRAKKKSLLDSVEAMARRASEVRGGGETAPPAPSEAAESSSLEQAKREEAEREAELEADRAEAEEKKEAAEREARVKAEQEEAERARAEAEARRQEEAEKFRKEQEEARKEQERRAQEEAEKKSQAAQKLRANMYGGFKRKN
jgi:hypothetical protein